MNYVVISQKYINAVMSNQNCIISYVPHYRTGSTLWKSRVSVLGSSRWRFLVCENLHLTKLGVGKTRKGIRYGGITKTDRIY